MQLVFERSPGEPLPRPAQEELTAFRTLSQSTDKYSIASIFATIAGLAAVAPGDFSEDQVTIRGQALIKVSADAGRHKHALLATLVELAQITTTAFSESEIKDWGRCLLKLVNDTTEDCSLVLKSIINYAQSNSKNFCLAQIKILSELAPYTQSHTIDTLNAISSLSKHWPGGLSIEELLVIEELAQDARESTSEIIGTIDSLSLIGGIRLDKNSLRDYGLVLSRMLDPDPPFPLRLVVDFAKKFELSLDPEALEIFASSDFDVTTFKNSLAIAKAHKGPPPLNTEENSLAPTDLEKIRILIYLLEFGSPLDTQIILKDSTGLPEAVLADLDAVPS